MDIILLELGMDYIKYVDKIKMQIKKLRNKFTKDLNYQIPLIRIKDNL